MKRIFKHHGTFATCNIRKEFEKPTIQGLAMTPREIKELAEKGIPVTMQNSAPSFPPSPENGFYVDPMFRRDSDINELWEIEKSTAQKILNAQSKDIQNYG